MKLNVDDWTSVVYGIVVLGVATLAVLETYEVTDVVTDVPSIEQPECIGDQIIIGRDE